MPFRLAAAALAAAAALTPAMAQDVTLEPTFGVFSLATGFQPDPNWISVLAGGEAFAEFTDRTTGEPCSGHFAEAPDFRLVFEPGSAFPLILYVRSRDDTVLLVNAPDGAWHCNDDHDGLNPQIDFDAPLAGQYDIWIGTYDALEDDYPEARLGITEIGPEAGPADIDFERAFFGQDDRVEVDPTRAPWSMIGFLDSDAAFCTGVLIGPDVVLTAAHCLANGGVIDAPPVAFYAGYDRGRYVAQSAASGFHLPAGWLEDEADGTDFAFVYLAEPIGNTLGWMDVAGLDPAEIKAFGADAGPEILQAGYSFDRDGVMTGNLDCPFVALEPDSALVHQCDTLEGDSGSPLFLVEGGRFRVIGIESYTEERPRARFDRNVATHAESIVAEMTALGLR